MGVVYVDITASSSGAANTTVNLFTLPAGYRPLSPEQRAMYFPCSVSSTVNVNGIVNDNGLVQIYYSTTSGQSISLKGLSGFHADA